MARIEETARSRVRCAVYTRKSSDEGLEQDYNSIDAQRDAGQAYIASQRHEGWIPVAMLGNRSKLNELQKEKSLTLRISMRQ